MQITEHTLRLIASDRAMLTSFRALNPELIALMREIVGDPIPGAKAPRVKKLASDFPVATDVRAVELTLFDKHLGAKNPKRIRKPKWGINIKAWLSDYVDFENADWASNGMFWPVAEIPAKMIDLQTNKKNPISDTTRGFANLLAGEEHGNDFVGLFRFSEHGEGSKYVDEHFVGMTMKNGVPVSIRVITPFACFEVEGFSPLDSGKKALKGEAVFQSRFSPRGDMTGWVTGQAKWTDAMGVPISINREVQ
jgi:hypothetical protein